MDKSTNKSQSTDISRYKKHLKLRNKETQIIEGWKKYIAKADSINVFQTLEKMWLWHKDGTEADLKRKSGSQRDPRHGKKKKKKKRVSRCRRRPKWDGKQLLSPAVRASCSWGFVDQDGGIQRHFRNGGGGVKYKEQTKGGGSNVEKKVFRQVSTLLKNYHTIHFLLLNCTKSS